MKTSKLKKFAVVATGVTLTLSLTSLTANATVFYLQGTFDDGGKFSGCFNYDNQAQKVTNWDILTTQGFDYPGTTYTSRNPKASYLEIQNEPGSIPINVLFQFRNNLNNLDNIPVGTLYEQDFQIEFPNQFLTNFKGGLIPTGLGNEVWSSKTGPGSGTGIERVSVTGSATLINVPEPDDSRQQHRNRRCTPQETD